MLLLGCVVVVCGVLDLKWYEHDAEIGAWVFAQKAEDELAFWCLGLQCLRLVSGCFAEGELASWLFLDDVQGLEWCYEIREA